MQKNKLFINGESEGCSDNCKVQGTHEILSGEKVHSIGRCAAMCWIAFGDSVEIDGLKGKRLVGKLALHLQCPWRISSGSQILLSSADMFVPAAGHDNDANFNWDIQGHNLFDEKVNTIFGANEIITVTDVKLSAFYDLAILFSNSVLLECFVDQSTDYECWRLFKPGDNLEGFVISGLGLEYDSEDD